MCMCIDITKKKWGKQSVAWHIFLVFWSATAKWKYLENWAYVWRKLRSFLASPMNPAVKENIWEPLNSAESGFAEKRRRTDWKKQELNLYPLISNMNDDPAFLSLFWFTAVLSSLGAIFFSFWVCPFETGYNKRWATNTSYSKVYLERLSFQNTTTQRCQLKTAMISHKTLSLVFKASSKSSAILKWMFVTLRSNWCTRKVQNVTHMGSFYYCGILILKKVYN